MLEPVFRHLLRYRVTTYPALTRAFPTVAESDRREIFSHLLSEGLLLPLQDVDPEIFELSESGAKAACDRLGRTIPNGFSRLAPIHLMRAYGALAFCFLNPTPRRLTLREELLQQFPSFRKCNRAISFYLEITPTGEQLGALIVDQGRDPRRLQQKLSEISRYMTEFEDAREIQQCTGFRFGLVVARDSTRREVMALFKNPRYRLPSPPAIVVAPELEKFYPLIVRKGGGFKKDHVT